MHVVTYNGGSNIFAIMINIIILSVDKSKAGATKAASARWHGLVGSALHAEAEALRDGVSLPAGTTEHHRGH
jgi:hypothetical protein